MIWNRSSGRVKLVALVASACAAAGCTTLLRNDFEGYSGQNLDGGIPGEPDGDTMETSGSPHLYEISSMQPLDGSRSMRLHEATLAVEDPFELVFVPIPAPSPTRDIQISWKGRFANASQFTQLTFTVQQAPFENNVQAILRVRINAGRMTIHGGNLADRMTDGDFTQYHRVFIRLSPTDGTYVVDVSEGGVDSDFEANGNLDIDPDELIPLRIRLHVEYTSSHSGTGTDYQFDDVLIQQRE